jgi:hypothetical protein
MFQIPQKEFVKQITESKTRFTFRWKATSKFKLPLASFVKKKKKKYK